MESGEISKNVSQSKNVSVNERENIRKNENISKIMSKDENKRGNVSKCESYIVKLCL